MTQTHRQRRRFVFATLTVFALVAAYGFVALTDIGTASWRAAHRPCGDEPTTDLRPGPEARLSEVEGTQDIEQPVAVTELQSETLLIGTREGTIWKLHSGRASTLLDLSSEVRSRGDGGLLGLAVPADDSYLFVLMTALDGDIELRAYPLSTNGTHAEVADGARVLLEVPTPTDNHAGGGLEIGPDGWLYIGLGDGGTTGDSAGNGQDPGDLLGAVLRILATPEDPDPYQTAAGAPFGPDGAPEVMAIGLRNPFRLAFAANGDLWVIDPGDSCIDEVNLIPLADLSGANLGWNRFEGTRSYVGGSRDGVTMPVATVPHVGGWCSVVGADVVPDGLLEGRLIVGDYCTGTLLAIGERNSLDLGAELEGLVSVDALHSGRIIATSISEGMWEIRTPRTRP